MASSNEVKLAVITLPLSEFNAHPEYKKIVVEDEDCRQFVEDVRDIKKAGGPAWFLQHLPKAYWSELEESVKAQAYQRGFNRPVFKFLQLVATMLVGAGALATALYFLPPNRSQIIEQFELDHHLRTINDVLSVSKPEATIDSIYLSKFALNWIEVSMNTIGDSRNDVHKQKRSLPANQRIQKHFRDLFD